MSANLKLMCILAHPDDESLGMGGPLAKYAAEGIETYLVTATRGERGRFGEAAERPAPEIVGRVREAELMAAASELGIREVTLLGYPDGGLDRVDACEIQAKIAAEIRRVRPHVAVTFGPEGGYGHPDHIAISQFATGAVVCAADPNYGNGQRPPHRVSKLYYMAWRKDRWDAYQAALRTLKVSVDGIERLATPWPDWAITTVVETIPQWPVVWRAVSCHKTQMAIYKQLERLPEEHHHAIWGFWEYYRVFSSVNGGRTPEADLFAGLR